MTTKAYSRRNLLRAMGVGAAAVSVARPLSEAAALFEPARLGTSDGLIHLNSNENVYGPPQKALEAMRAACASANRYPLIEEHALAKRIASFHGVDASRVLVGCGSTEILRVAAVAFLGAGKTLLQASPTFGVMENYVKSVGAQVSSVKLGRHYVHDVGTMLERVDGAVSLIYICNPNNPTASITPRKDLETFVSKLPEHCCVVIDEAYHHYTDQTVSYRSFIDHPVNHPRIIVCRTFSAAYGLAGLRLGYGVAPAAVVELMRPHLTSNGVNSVAAQAALAALEDEQSVRRFVKQNADDRQEFFNQAVARRLKPIDSHTNFVMMNTGHPAEQVIEHFRQRRILIGPPFPELATYIRVSLGTAQEMEAFWKAWDALPFANQHGHH